MNSIIFIEGGGDSKELHSRCREAFKELLLKMGFARKLPRLVACGGRSSVFDDFQSAMKSSTRYSYVAMWVDSEEPMVNEEAAWTHLESVSSVAAWKRPTNADDDQVLFMTTCMETWIVADRAALRSHYDDKFRETALPNLIDLERRTRGQIQDGLSLATKKCKNRFEKGKRSFAIFAKLAPDVLKKHCPSFRRVHRVLEAKLK